MFFSRPPTPVQGGPRAAGCYRGASELGHAALTLRFPAAASLGPRDLTCRALVFAGRVERSPRYTFRGGGLPADVPFFVRSSVTRLDLVSFLSFRAVLFFCLAFSQNSNPGKLATLRRCYFATFLASHRGCARLVSQL